jgi:hypothetical protein
MSNKSKAIRAILNPALSAGAADPGAAPLCRRTLGKKCSQRTASQNVRTKTEGVRLIGGLNRPI